MSGLGMKLRSNTCRYVIPSEATHAWTNEEVTAKAEQCVFSEACFVSFVEETSFTIVELWTVGWKKRIVLANKHVCNIAWFNRATGGGDARTGPLGIVSSFKPNTGN